jgi:hypothetical protein
MALALLGLLLGLGVLLIVVASPLGGQGAVEHFMVGVLVGTMFGQAIVAGAWTALGPLGLKWRLPAALVWVGLLAAALDVNLEIHGGPHEVVGVMLVCMFGMWLLVLIPLAVVVRWHGVTIRAAETMVAAADYRRTQFGIRQLMILTAVIGVTLGVGRVAAPLLIREFTGGRWGELPVFAFLAAAGVLMMVPLILASLLPRHAAIGCGAALLFIVLMSCLELPMLNATLGARGGPQLDHIVWINSFQTGWILISLGLLRLAGYRLAPRGEGTLGEM